MSDDDQELGAVDLMLAVLGPHPNNPDRVSAERQQLLRSEPACTENTCLTVEIQSHCLPEDDVLVADCR
jgi:hypothetical protein